MLYVTLHNSYLSVGVHSDGASCNGQEPVLARGRFPGAGEAPGGERAGGVGQGGTLDRYSGGPGGGGPCQGRTGAGQSHPGPDAKIAREGHPQGAPLPIVSRLRPRDRSPAFEELKS